MRLHGLHCVCKQGSNSHERLQGKGMQPEFCPSTNYIYVRSYAMVTVSRAVAATASRAVAVRSCKVTPGLMHLFFCRSAPIWIVLSPAPLSKTQTCLIRPARGILCRCIVPSSRVLTMMDPLQLPDTKRPYSPVRPKQPKKHSPDVLLELWHCTSHGCVTMAYRSQGASCIRFGSHPWRGVTVCECRYCVASLLMTGCIRHGWVDLTRFGLNLAVCGVIESFA